MAYPPIICRCAPPCPLPCSDADGVYDGRHCDNNLHEANHAMLLVGWQGTDHWIIKNSW